MLSQQIAAALGLGGVVLAFSVPMAALMPARPDVDRESLEKEFGRLPDTFGLVGALAFFGAWWVWVLWASGFVYSDATRDRRQ